MFWLTAESPNGFYGLYTGLTGPTTELAQPKANRILTITQLRLLFKHYKDRLYNILSMPQSPENCQQGKLKVVPMGVKTSRGQMRE